MTKQVALEIGTTPNYATVQIGDLRLYFSYRTVIAFDTPETGTVVRENAWGPTTGKHLNRIDNGDKKNRVSSGAFTLALEYTLKNYGLACREVLA